MIKPKRYKTQRLDIQIGEKYNNLTIIKEVEKRNNRRHFLCKCDCGNEKIIRIDGITSGHAKTCGCLQLQVAKKHGFFGTRIYQTWVQMKARCFNEQHKHYKDYGGRGITVCDEWKDDFMTYYYWSIDNGYAENLSIDRIENDGNYEPSNCRWVSMQMQANNKRNNRLIEYNNQTHTLAEWSRILGINYKTLKARIITMCWDVKRAFETPVAIKGGKN